jgi:hypothetical protein
LVVKNLINKLGAHTKNLKMKSITVLPEDFSGKDVRKYNRTFGTSFLRRKIRRTNDLQTKAAKIRGSVNHASLLARIKNGEIKPFRSTLKGN